MPFFSGPLLPAFAGVPSRARSLALLGIFVATVANSATPASTAPLDLAEAVRLAERDAPMIAARRAEAESALQLIGPAGERPDPELVAGIDNLPVSSGDAFNLNRDFMTMRKIGVMQAFPRREKRELRVQRATADSARAQALLTAEQLGTREAVAIAWIALAHAEQRLALAMAMRTQGDLLVSAATAAISSGRGSATDAITAKQARIALEDRIDALALERDQGKTALAQWLPDDAGRPLGETPNWTELGPNASRWQNRIQHHRELLAYDAITRSAEAEVALARAEKRPDWSMELAYADRGPDYSNMISLEFRIGLPLFSSRRQDPTIASREATLVQVQAERAAAERMHRAEIDRTYAAWRSALKRTQRYQEELLPLGDDRAATALAAYRGSGGSLQNALAAFDAALEQRMAYVDVLDVLGQSWAALHFAFAEER